VRQLTAVAGGILRDAAGDRPGWGVPGRRLRPLLATGHGTSGSQTVVPGGGRMGGPGVTHPPSAVAAAQGLRQLVGSALRLAEGQLADGGPVDEFGFDPAFNARYLMPIARFFYQRWFRVQIRGLEHVPADGAALVVANHSGTLPMDAVMLQAGLHDEHPTRRNLRLLGADLVDEIPLLSALARKSGHIPAAPANADALLHAGELVGVFPEGFKGIGKPFADRYQLRRFGRGGFAATAIRDRVPLIPCAIVGAEEIYPMLGNARQLAELLRLPYFPITPLFPWLGPVGVVPLPSRWIIEFCPPVPTNGYQPGDETDPAAVYDLSGRVRGTIQRKLDDLIAERGPAFG
jgi:1-acyl-sn-glycerol-3-phosphate acyltransferase